MVVHSADVRLCDYANANLNVAGSKKLSKKLRADNASAIRATLDWFDCDEALFDDIASDNHEDPSSQCVLPKRIYDRADVCRLVEYKKYPDDLWHLLAAYVQPECLVKFALICKDSAAVLRTATFWKSLYNKHCAQSPLLPEHYMPQAMHRRYGLRTAVIRSLHIAYQPFVCRAPAPNDILFNCKNAATLLNRCVCTGVWQERSAGLSSSGALWTYFFRFQTKHERVVNVDRRNGLQFLDDITANPDENHVVLRAVSRMFTHVPPSSVLGSRLNEVFISLNPGLFSQSARLGFSSKPDASCSTSVQINDVVGLQLLDWWHSAFPSTTLKLCAKQLAQM